MPLRTVPSNKTFIYQILTSLPDAGERQTILALYLQEKIAAALHISPDQIDHQQPLSYLGLDSLTSIDLQHQLEQDTGVTLPIINFLGDVSLSQLVGQILDAFTEAASQSLPTPSATTFPLSYGQQAIWFLHQLNPKSVAYTIAKAVCIRGSLDVTAWQEACRQLVKQHPSLRTAFFEQEGQPYQTIHEQVPDICQFHRADDWSETDLYSFLTTEAHRPFDLTQPPLVCLHLCRRSDQEHIVLLIIHHIIADFWSLALFVQELSKLYEAIQAGKPVPVGKVPISYESFVRWEQDLLKTPAAEQSAAYWQTQLAGELPLLNLPTDFPRPSRQTYRGAAETIHFNPTTTKQLHRFSQVYHTTPFTILLAAFHLLLARFTGQTDILIGVPTSGREHAQWAELIGYFVNPVVVRTHVDYKQPFSAFVAKVRQTVLDAFRHQTYPLALLVEALHPPRDPSHSPLFQTMFVWQQATKGHISNLAAFALDDTMAIIPAGSLTIESWPLSHQATQFDLMLFMAETAEGMGATFRYNSDLFAPETIQRLSKHFQTLFMALLQQPERRLADVTLLTEAELRQIVWHWNNTTVAYPKDTNLVQLFREQVARTPSLPAVVYEQTTLTYTELDQRTNQLAHHLLRLGVQPDELVGVYLERSLEMVISLYGVLKAGGAYVPLDPAHPPQRISSMLADAKVSLVLTQSHLAARIPATAATVICVDTDWARVTQEPTTLPPVTIMPTQMAYVIYTSGSTGIPKGVMNDHQGICNRLLWMQDTYALETTDCVLQKTPFTFDVSVWEFFWPLLAGAKLVIAKPNGHKDNAYLVNLINEAHVTTIHFVPPMLQQFLAQPQVSTCRSLRRVICSGETLSSDLEKRFFARLGAELHNLYGPTEAAIDVSYWACTPQTSLRMVPIGQPVANTQLYVLDAYLQPVPVGVVGELYIGGVQVARGYWRRPALTGEKFIPDPFASLEGRRLYATGDLAYWLPTGHLVFIGRKDNQVKLRGFRIELGEVEAVFNDHEQVQTALATIAGQPARLIVYVVATDRDGVSARELRQYAQTKLPDYMIPDTFLFLDAFSLNANGKIDRRTLPQPTFSRAMVDTAYVAPQTVTEALLAQVWGELLQIKQVGVEDNFFHLGGHSLIAIQLIARLRQTFHCEMPLHELFEAPTIAQLAQRIETQKGTESPRPIITGPRVSPNRPAPLSFAQEQIWFMHQLEPESPLYHMPVALQISGELDIQLLKIALAKMIERHSSLRTVFVMQEHQPTQVILSANDPDFTYVDLCSVPAERRQMHWQMHLQAEAIRPFNLNKGPLLRTILFQLADDHFILLCNLHHIIADGWSLNIFIHELTTFYTHLLTKETAVFLPQPVQYVDFALWQRQELHSDFLEKQAAYWRAQLHHVPSLNLPTDYIRPAVPTFQGKTITLTVPREQLEALRQLSLAHDVTIFMVWLGIIKTLLACYTGQDDILIGTPIANREQPEATHMLGLLINILPLRTHLNGEPTFVELLRRIRQVFLAAYAHRHLPFVELVKSLWLDEQDTSHLSFLQVIVAWQNATELSLPQTPSLTFKPLPIDTGTAKFDLTILLSDVFDGLTIDLNYNSDLFHADTMTRLGQHLQLLLTQIIANPNLPLSQYSLLSPTERTQLLCDLNDTITPYPKHVSLAESFEAQVAQTPTHIALVSGAQIYTYAELNQAANQLAHYLQQHGVTPGSVVGLCIDRSPNMIIGMLAILKVGGAYAPIDTTYPSERLALMFGDLHLRFLLTYRHLLPLFPQPLPETICLDAIETILDHESKHNPRPCSYPESLAYIMYTSGSTGQPKGIAVPQKAVIRLVKETNFVHVSASDVFLQFAPVSFDAATFEIWGCLLNGAKLVLPPANLPSLADIGRTIRTEQVTVLWLSVGLFRQMVQEQPDDLTSVRQLLTGGDVVPPAPVKYLLRRHPTCQVTNGYGPTENTTFTTYFQMQSDDQVMEPIPIGSPVANTQVYILDKHQQPVSTGVVGELYAAGEGLAQGYWRQPTLTAMQFVPNPFGPAGTRMYRTGDLARYLPNGQIVFLGRVDNQVKVRGFRVELGEIEAVLHGHPLVTDVVVRAPRQAGHKQLVAYLVTDEEISADEVRQFAQQKLPVYMVPAYFVFMSAFPLTSNGKIDYRALPIPTAVSSRTRIPPRNDWEAQLLTIWQTLFQRQDISIDDNFFAVGGHSLLATQAVSQIRKTFQLDIPLKRFLETPTIEKLAQYLEERAYWADKQPQTSNIEREEGTL